MNQTDDDWDADVGDETPDDFLQRKLKPPLSIEPRPAISSKRGGPSSSTTDLASKGPSYPSTRRKDSQGLKPQFEGLVRGKFPLQCTRLSTTAETDCPYIQTPATPYT